MCSKINEDISHSYQRFTDVNSSLWQECHSSLRIGRLVFGKVLEFVLYVFKVPNIAIAKHKVRKYPVNCNPSFELKDPYPLPARYRQFVPSSQNGIQTPDMESRIWKPPIGSVGALASHSPSWRSLIREKPVVAIRSCSPIHTARLFFAPGWPATSCAGFS